MIIPTVGYRVSLDLRLKKEMELTNCKLPDRLERLQQLWRERKSAVKAWGDFFRAPQWTWSRLRAVVGPK